MKYVRFFAFVMALALLLTACAPKVPQQEVEIESTATGGGNAGGSSPVASLSTSPLPSASPAASPEAPAEEEAAPAPVFPELPLPVSEESSLPLERDLYEAALQIQGAEVVLLSMGPEKTKDFLLSLTRLGAENAYLLCDKAFAGADTLATAYTLSLAVKKLQPDLVICGRQTVDGDTGQTGPSLARTAGLSLVTGVMEIKHTQDHLTCVTREEGAHTVSYPALITVERINQLRLPSIRSKRGTVTVWDRESLQADPNRCGIKGSPTKVLASTHNEEGKRRCRFVEPDMLETLIRQGLQKEKSRIAPADPQGPKLKKVWIVGEKCKDMAETVSDDITVIAKETPESQETWLTRFVQQVREQNPTAILWDSDPWSKRMAPQAAALLQTGLCADCTALQTDGEKLFMYRPAFAGNVIAKIVCTASPPMATVRTEADGTADVVISIGRGAKAAQKAIEDYVQTNPRFEIAASRGAVDLEMLPYHKQVGLTGKQVSPPVYIAVGISGAVHHIAGMKQSGTVIAINPDRQAPIFDYADFGIVAAAEEIFS